MKKRRISGKDAWRIVLLLVLVILLLGWFSRQYAGSGGILTKYGKHSPTAETSSSVSCGSSAKGVAKSSVQKNAISRPGRMELPRMDDSTFFLEDSDGHYALWYDTMYRQAAWVAYLLTKKEVEYKGAERTNRFVPDPKVQDRGWPTALTSDYAHSGYDRGHLLPSADRDDSRRENSTTFYLSNIAPQRPALNRGVWKSLEEQVRRWAAAYDSVYVVTGGVLDPGLDRIEGGVGVPDHFFKVVLMRYGTEYRCVGFLVPNSTSLSREYADYVVSVDEVENRTGYDFFSLLPDSLEERIESRVERGFFK